MLSFKLGKITDLESKLIKKIKQLECEIMTLPAYTRKKRAEKNKTRFYMISMLIALIGVIIFGSGWFAVALMGTALSIIIVECGLFSSMSFPFIARPLYNAYLGLRNLFNSEKIKNQNKAYDQCQRILATLKKLAAKKEILSTKIQSKLDAAITSFLFTFSELSLKSQIKRLKQEMKNHPAHLRNQKDKQRRDKIFYYSAVISVMGSALSIMTLFMMQVASSAILLGPIFPVLVIIEAIFALILLGPIAVSRLGYAIYLGVRNEFSSSKTKAENQHYKQLEKTITELEKLQYPLTQLDKKISNALQLSVESLTQVTHELKREKNNSDNLESNRPEVDKRVGRYGKLFLLPPSLTNQTKESGFTIQKPRNR